MAEDIVETLRDPADWDPHETRRKAADEIERLRGKLADRDALIAEALGAIQSTDYIMTRAILSRAPEGAADRIRAEQREVDARIAEGDQFDGDDPRSSDEVAYNTARQEAAAAIRGGDPRGE